METVVAEEAAHYGAKEEKPPAILDFTAPPEPAAHGTHRVVVEMTAPNGGPIPTGWGIHIAYPGDRPDSKLQTQGPQ